MDDDFAIGGKISWAELNGIYYDKSKKPVVKDKPPFVSPPPPIKAERAANDKKDTFVLSQQNAKFLSKLKYDICNAIRAAYFLISFDNETAGIIIFELFKRGLSKDDIELAIDGIKCHKYLEQENITKSKIDITLVVDSMAQWDPLNPLKAAKEKEQVEQQKKLPSPDKFFERRGFPLSFCIWSMGLCVAEYEQVANIVQAGGREKFEKEYIPKLYDYHKFLREEWPTSLYNPDYKRERYQANAASKLSVSLLELLELARAREAT